jgi:hypothetical protein
LLDAISAAALDPSTSPAVRVQLAMQVTRLLDVVPGVEEVLNSEPAAMMNSLRKVMDEVVTEIRADPEKYAIKPDPGAVLTLAELELELREQQVRARERRIVEKEGQAEVKPPPVPVLPAPPQRFLPLPLGRPLWPDQ